MNSTLVTPPQSPEEEGLVIGVLVLDPAKVDVVEPILLPEDFGNSDNKDLYVAIISLSNRGLPIDATTVVAEVTKMRGSDADVRDLADHCIRLMDRVPHVNHIRNWADTVAKTAMRRRIQAVAPDFIRLTRNPALDPQEVVASITASLEKITHGRVRDSAKQIGELFGQVLDHIASGVRQVIPTGLLDFDARFYGLVRGGLNVLAARPGVGKTALVGQIATYSAKQGRATLIYSLEQDAGELAQRTLSSEAQVDSRAIRACKVGVGQMDRMRAVASDIGAIPLYIDDTSPKTLAQIIASTRRHVTEHKVELVIIDYLQNVSPDDTRLPREQQVAAITRGLRNLAKQLNIAVLVIASMNRQFEQRDVKRPRLSDLRESGNIESDADLVFFLDRPGMRTQEAATETILIVAKNRHGECGDIHLHFDGATMTYRAAAHPSISGEAEYQGAFDGGDGWHSGDDSDTF